MKLLFHLALAVSCANAFQRPLEREGELWTDVHRGSLEPGDSQQLQVSANGRVAVSGCACAQVSYVLRKKVAARSEADARRVLAELDLRWRRLGPAFYVQMAGKLDSVLTELDIKVPRNFRAVQVDTVSGTIDARNLAPDLRAFTGSGQISADGLGGRIYARTGSGPIRIGSVGGDATLESGGGAISVERAWGVLQATTDAGNIEVKRAAGAVTAVTRGGLIVVHESGGTVTATSGGGAIQIGSAKGAQCELVTGGIRLSGVSGELRALTGLGDIVAELAMAALRDSLISSSSGDITVVIPSNLAVTVEAVNDSPAFSGRIVSDFPEIRTFPRKRGSRSLTAGGDLNGGGPVLRVAAAEGTIYLRQK